MASFLLYEVWEEGQKEGTEKPGKIISFLATEFFMN